MLNYLDSHRASLVANELRGFAFADYDKSFAAPSCFFVLIIDLENQSLIDSAEGRWPPLDRPLQ